MFTFLFRWFVFVFTAFIFVPAPVLAACVEDDVAPKNDVVYSDTIFLAEIFPNPAGDEKEGEFIELVNISKEVVDVRGWKIADASGKEFVLDGDVKTVVAGGARWVVFRSVSGLSLNNSGGETVSLYTPDGDEKDSVSYTGSAREGESFSRRGNGEWEWTSDVTPGKENVFSEDEGVSEGEDDRAADGAASDPENNDAVGEDSSEEEISVETTPEEVDGLEGAASDSGQDAPLVFLNEMLPDPVGSDAEGEWIEVWNGGAVRVNLAGWKLTDGTGEYVWPAEAWVEAGAYVGVIRKTSGIALNNEGDNLRLLNAEGEEVDGTTYGKAPVGSSWARDTEGDWVWTMYTSFGTENVLPQARAQDSSGADSVSGSEGATGRVFSAGKVLTIQEVRSKQNGAVVRVRGKVTAPIGVFSNTFFYIADDTGGVQIGVSGDGVPDMLEGYEVEVTGRLSQAHSERKLNVKSEDVQVIIEQEKVLDPVILTGRLQEEFEGRLVRVSGLLQNKQATRFMLGDVVVVMKKMTGISGEGLSNGGMFSVVGIVTQQKDEYQLWPRLARDIVPDTGGAGALTRVKAVGGEGAGVSDAALFSADTGTEILRRAVGVVRAHPYVSGGVFLGGSSFFGGVFWVLRKKAAWVFTLIKRV